MTIHVNMNMNEKIADKEFQTGKFGTVSISGKKQEKESKNSQSMMLNGQFDPIEQKKALAKKQAYKIVKDALANELRMDADVQESKDHADRLREEMSKAQEEINRIDAEKEDWRKECGVDADSEEQKDLELLEKRDAYERGDFSKALTEEEKERVAELDKRGFTAYQERALALEKGKAPYEKTVREAQQDIISDNAVIRGTRLVRLKKDFIRKAQREEKAVLEAAGKEVIGMLVDEAKEHMDEKSEELKEKAEEKAKEEEAQQEKLDAAKERREETEALAQPEKAEQEPAESAQSETLSGDKTTQELVQLDGRKEDFQREIEEMMKKMNLTSEDIKGIKVDEIF